MPNPGDIDQPYPARLLEIGIKINEPFKGAKQHHALKCDLCSHEWLATPLSKLQNFKKHGIKGCPRCSKLSKYTLSRTANIKIIQDRGLEIISDWDGARVSDAQNTPIDVTVRNLLCGHTFTSTAVNLLTHDITCTVCGKWYRTSYINHWSELNSSRWRQTATDWQKYKSTVTKQSRASYIANKHTINPNNLPTGRAGTEGAYHIDHIVPIRYCFNHRIPEEACSHFTNLQMLGWRVNVGSRDKLKENVPVPELLRPYINQ